ncbi:MAG: FtsH protease activity modulator HflK [Gammaproteobacteria bacterium]|nr:FtsH protease activity modulator HflK [Gammaproteobacteria bacterium]
MPWKQPGSDGNDNDPWGQKNNSNNGSDRQDGPPDLDQIFRDAKDRVDSIFGGRKGGGGRRGSGSGGSSLGGGAIGLILLVGIGMWLFSGVYTVDQGEQAIELRFGKYKETNEAGLNWHIPAPFESVEMVNVENVNTVEVGYRKNGRNIQSVPREALMLTEDENIIDIQFAVQYDIKNPTDLLFNVSEYNSRDIANTVVRQATESAVREIVGRNTMDFAITDGRAQLAIETKILVQEILDRYETGINIRSVEMQNAQPPMQVKDAFDDVVRAREDEERLKNLAEAYANDIIPKARGFASRAVQEAEGYQAAVVARAAGESSRFMQILEEYQKAPDITRERLYLETMEQVMSNSSKMFIDQKDGGNNVMYLPLDQLLKDRAQSSGSSTGRSDFNSSSISGANQQQSSNNGFRSTTRDANRQGRE